MRTYPVKSDSGGPTPIFQIDSIYMSARAIAALLSRSDNVSNVRLGRAIPGETRDVKVRFDYLGQPFMVWEPFGDNSRYWIGPADMVQGEPDVPTPPSIDSLRLTFDQHRPQFLRAVVGDILTLNFLKGRP